MLKRLNTKYIDFINEDLYMKGEVAHIISLMMKSDRVASILYCLNSSYSLYPDDSVINWVSMGDNLNMLKYVATNNRNKGDVWNQRSIEMRVGRMIRRIISDVVKDKTKLTYTGKAIISSEKKLHTTTPSNDKVTSIIFSKETDVKTEGEFRNVFYGSDFLMYTENEEMGPVDITRTKVKIKIGGMTYESIVFDYLDDSYRRHWDAQHVDFIIQCNEQLPIGTTQSILVNNKLPEDASKYVIDDVEFEFENKFGGKSIEEINDSDIEKFVNEFIALTKSMRAPEDSKIEEVKGEDIRKWYLSSNYKSTIGQLGGSCMSYPECQRYLDIYTENPERISLLILKDKEDKLLGRALLWKLDNGKLFMDRVYCLTEYDERLFVNYAKEKGYYYRNNGNNGNIKFFLDGKEVDIQDELYVSVTNSDFDNYPYIDTLKDFDMDKSVLHYGVREFDFDREFRDTGGKWTGYEEDE